MPEKALTGGAQPGIALAVFEQAGGRGAGRQAQAVVAQVAANGGGIDGRRAVGGQEPGGWRGGAVGRCEGAGSGLLYRNTTLVVPHPQPAAGGIFAQRHHEILGQPVFFGEGDEVYAVVTHEALAGTQPEVALLVLQQRIDKRLP